MRAGVQAVGTAQQRLAIADARQQREMSDRERKAEEMALRAKALSDDCSMGYWRRCGSPGGRVFSRALGNAFGNSNVLSIKPPAPTVGYTAPTYPASSARSSNTDVSFAQPNSAVSCGPTKAYPAEHNMLSERNGSPSSATLNSVGSGSAYAGLNASRSASTCNSSSATWGSPVRSAGYHPY